MARCNARKLLEEAQRITTEEISKLPLEQRSGNQWLAIDSLIAKAMTQVGYPIKLRRF